MTAVTVAAAAASVVAVSLAPTGDEFHTLAYMRQTDLGQVWSGYQEVGDTLPPLWYAVTWLAGQVFGQGIATPRSIAVVSWAAGAGVLARMLTPWGSLASLTGALVPTASTMLFFGGWARPYASVFLAVALAVWAWRKTLDRPSPRHLLALAASVTVAVALHYAAIGAVLAIGAAELLTPGGGSRQRAPVLVALGTGTVSILVSVPLLADAIANHSRIPSAAGPMQVAAFYWSATRPILGPMAVVVLAIWCLVVVRRHGAVRRIQLQPEELVGLCLTALVPLLSVVGMAVTSGVYLHRYSLTALVGIGLVAGCLTGRMAHHDRRVAAFATGAVVIGVLAAPHLVAQGHLSREDAEGLPQRLGLEVAATRVVVADPYTFELLAEMQPDLLPGLTLLAPSPYVGRQGTRVAGGAEGRERVVLVGSDEAVRQAIAESGESCGVLTEAVRSNVAGASRTFVACTVEP